MSRYALFLVLLLSSVHAQADCLSRYRQALSEPSEANPAPEQDPGIQEVIRVIESSREPASTYKRKLAIDFYYFANDVHSALVDRLLAEKKALPDFDPYQFLNVFRCIEDDESLCKTPDEHLPLRQELVENAVTLLLAADPASCDL